MMMIWWCSLINLTFYPYFNYRASLDIVNVYNYTLCLPCLLLFNWTFYKSHYFSNTKIRSLINISPYLFAASFYICNGTARYNFPLIPVPIISFDRVLYLKIRYSLWFNGFIKLRLKWGFDSLRKYMCNCVRSVTLCCIEAVQIQRDRYYG